MRVHVPAPTLLSRVTVDQDLDMTGYKVVNAGNVDLQTDGVIINDLLIKRQDSNNIHLRNSGDTLYKRFYGSDLLAKNNLYLDANGCTIRTKNIDDTYALIKARENTVGLAEIARITGAATPTFDIKSGRLTGDLNCNGYKVYGDKVAVGDNPIIYNDTEGNVGAALDTPTKVKEIRVTIGGTYRVKFDMRVDDTSITMHGRIYKNGVAFGTDHTTSSTSYATYAEDLDFAAGDLIQLYINSEGVGTGYMYYRNLRPCCSEFETATNTLE